MMGAKPRKGRLNQSCPAQHRRSPSLYATPARYGIAAWTRLRSITMARLYCPAKRWSFTSTGGRYLGKDVGLGSKRQRQMCVLEQPRGSRSTLFTPRITWRPFFYKQHLKDEDYDELKRTSRDARHHTSQECKDTASSVIQVRIMISEVWKR